MTTQMIVRLDDKVKTKLSRFAQSEGKNTSQVVRELIESYIQERDMGPYIDDLWRRVGARMKANGVTTASIDKAVNEVRASKA